MNVLSAPPFRLRLLALLLGLWLIGTLAYAQTVQRQLDEADNEPDVKRAVELYSAILQKYPDLAEGYYGRAVVQAQLGQFTEALSDIEIALKQNPNEHKRIAQRAYIYVQVNDYDRAADDYRRAIELAPGQAGYYSGLSYCLTKHNRLAEAERVAEQGIRLDRSSPYAYRNRGRARLYRGRIEAAIADFETSLQLKHGQAYRVYSDLGEAYEQKKQLEKALACYRQALDLKADYPDALVRKTILEQQFKGSSPPSGAATSTFTGRRVALVIGNSQYAESVAGNLEGQPLNDAKAMQERLTALGFTAKITTDATYEVMSQALNTFYRDAKGADIALLFFAGHGLEHAQTNYLLPIDTNIDTLAVGNFSRKAISVTSVIDQLQDQQPRYCVIIMDACRSDPYKDQPAKPAAVTATVPVAKSAKEAAGPPNLPGLQLKGRGFRPIRVESRIRNCCIALATAPGATARNGPRRNGYYTEALLRFMHQGQRLDDVFSDVRGEVIAQTRKAGFVQLPEFINRAIDRMIL